MSEPGEDEKKEAESGDGKEKQDSGSSEKKDKDSGGQKDPNQNSDSGDDKKPKKPPIYKKPGFKLAVIIIALVLVVGGLIIWSITRQYVSTDDAYIDGHIVQISPQVSAKVIALHIDDNQFVRQGDFLVELDRTDYEVALQQAKAQVAEAEGKRQQAVAQIEAARANVPQAIAEEHGAEASYTNAQNDLQRYLRVDPRARSQQQLESAGTSETNAEARLEEAHAKVVVAQTDVETAIAAEKAAEGQMQTALASVKRAEVNLGYCNIVAPCDGRVTQRTVERGNYVVTGQALFMIVDPNIWVTANFKETQLTLMRPGQPVRIKVDAFPDFHLEGKVESIQAGSGSRFSVLPAENATGNFVKIVQRVPVKIVFNHDANTNNAPMLSPGLSVVPKVKIR